jgi:hypothetical protein
LIIIKQNVKDFEACFIKLIKKTIKLIFQTNKQTNKQTEEKQRKRYNFVFVNNLTFIFLDIIYIIIFSFIYF